ncbi:hypothetical protein BJV74DRAFT_343708 [Russula compacta]|nr:hypothetical protein BJV74DRAFT_343708 [Russula compacta]
MTRPRQRRSGRRRRGGERRRCVRAEHSHGGGRGGPTLVMADMEGDGFVSPEFDLQSASEHDDSHLQKRQTWERSGKINSPRNWGMKRLLHVMCGVRYASDPCSDQSRPLVCSGPQLEPRRPHAETPIQDTAAAMGTTDKPEDSVQAYSDATLGGVQGLAESQLKQ